jgi:hypothetical protein
MNDYFGPPPVEPLPTDDFDRLQAELDLAIEAEDFEVVWVTAGSLGLDNILTMREAILTEARRRLHPPSGGAPGES